MLFLFFLPFLRALSLVVDLSVAIFLRKITEQIVYTVCSLRYKL